MPCAVERDAHVLVYVTVQPVALLVVSVRYPLFVGNHLINWPIVFFLQIL